jgi:hypothetical protein
MGYHRVKFRDTEIILKSDSPEEAIMNRINHGPEITLQENEEFEVEQIHHIN